MANWRSFPCGCKIWANSNGEILRRYDKENHWCGKDIAAFKDSSGCYTKYLIVKSTDLESVDGNQQYIRDWVLKLSTDDTLETIKEIMSDENSTERY